MTSRLARLSRRPPAPLRLVSGLISLLVLCRSTAAAAEPRDPIDLEWTAPAECPRVDAVRARLRELAGPRQPRSQTFRAEVTITRKPDGALHLRLLVRSGSLAGERNMDGKSCKVLAGAAAVTLVLMLHSTDPSTESDSTGSSAAASNGDKSPTTPASEAQRTAPRLGIRRPMQPRSGIPLAALWFPRRLPISDVRHLKSMTTNERINAVGTSFSSFLKSRSGLARCISRASDSQLPEEPPSIVGAFWPKAASGFLSIPPRRATPSKRTAP